MKVSVVLATYNGAEFIQEQLDSLLEQTCPVDELVVCDDVSKDDTVQRIRDYIEAHGLTDCWHVYTNETNLGFANNFGKALSLATGDYILFSDQDDVWEKTKIAQMTAIMDEHPDCQVLCSDYEPLYQTADAPRAPQRILDRMPNNGQLEKIALNPKNVYLAALGCCMCLRRSFRDAIEPYWFDGWAHDDRFWRLAVCADGCYVLHSNLVQHRIHGHNTATYGKYHTLERRISLFREKQNANKQMLRYLNDHGADQTKKTVMQKHISAMELRLALLEKKKIWNVVPLVRYVKYYEAPKSLVVDAILTMKES